MNENVKKERLTEWMTELKEKRKNEWINKKKNGLMKEK